MSSVTPAIISRLLDEHADRLELYAIQWSDSPEDIVQEAFIELAQQEQLPRQPVSWLYRVVRNRAISWRRSHQSRKKHESTYVNQTRAWFEENPGSQLDAQTVAEALQKIPEEEREVIVAHIWGGLTFEQIAEITGTTSSTAHRYYQSGLKSLKNLLDLSWKTKNK
jgi:RNA polymerase sigma factor (sigma-70 family)